MKNTTNLTDKSTLLKNKIMALYKYTNMKIYNEIIEIKCIEVVNIIKTF